MILLRPQDVLILARLATQPDAAWTYASLAAAVRMSASEVHAAVRRATAAALMDAQTRRPIARNLIEFLVHGIRYVFVAERSALTRGVPTAHSAPPLSAQIGAGSEPPLVWPHPSGSVRGESLEPLCRGAVEAALADRDLYEILALIDAVRVGTARERTLAADHLRKRLS